MRLLCLHSLTAHGDVGLKPFLATLGSACLPIPTVLLSGPANFPGVPRQPTDAPRLLAAALAHCATHPAPTDLFIGYLASAAQLTDLLPVLDEHHAAYDHLIIDPVCGDHGRPYVTADLVAAWPNLAARADLLVPNLTEARLLTAPAPDPLTALRALAPRAALVITGADDGPDILTHHQLPDFPWQSHRQPRVGAPASGTGDRFAAHLWQAYRKNKYPLAASVHHAATAVAAHLAG